MADQKQQQQSGPLIFEGFAGINTLTTRPGVPDEQMAWCDGFFPIAPRNLRTLWGIGSSAYSVTPGAIVGLGSITPGSGGSGGPFSSVALTGGSGTGAYGSVTLSGGSVSTVGIIKPGTNYVVGDVLSAASDTIGGVTGFSVPVATLQQIVCFYFYNIGATAYAAVFLADGSLIQVNTLTGATTTILSAGSILSPSITNMGVSQYGKQYEIIVANQSNGYWIWDGSLLYQAGTLAPEVTLTNTGEGYVSAPVVTATGGHGSGPRFTALISGGVVTNVNITNPGAGYLPGDTVSLVFTGGTQAGSGAVVTAALSHVAGGSSASVGVDWEVTGTLQYGITGFFIINAGSGYGPLVTASWSNTNTAGHDSPGWVYGVPPLNLTITGGSVSAINYSGTAIFAAPGGTSQLPTISINDSGYYAVTSTSVIDAGSGYGPNCAVTASGGGSPQSQAVLSPFLTNGALAGVIINSGGVYGSNTPPTVTVTDSAVSAAGTVNLMPYGVQGNAIETFQGIVWVFNGPLCTFTAPGSVWNFATSDGGGSFTSSDSFLKVGYVQAVSTNGFLFVIGDSSMNYISGVTTTTPSGGLPTTTFTNNNSDPEVGTPYPAAVTTLGTDILIANSTGIFISSGGAFVKKSEALDGVYATVPSSNFNGNPFSGFQLSAAKATIFSKRVWMVLVPIVDPVSNTQVNKLLMFNGRYWWTSQQDVALTFIQGQEINSIYQAWGTDGTHLYPLFFQPSTGFTKTVQTKLWDNPGYEFNKTTGRFWSLWNCQSTTNSGFTVDIDAVGMGASGQFTNTQSYSITGPTNTGFFVTPAQAIGQQGVLIGMTFSTTAADMTLISASWMPDTHDYRG